MSSCFITMNVNDLISQKAREKEGRSRGEERNKTCSMNNKYEAKQTASLLKTYKQDDFKHVVTASISISNQTSIESKSIKIMNVQTE